MYTKYILFTYFRAQCNDGYHDVPQKKKSPSSQRSIIVDQQKKWAEIQSEEQNIRNKEKVEKKG